MLQEHLARKKDRLIRILNSWYRRKLTLYGKAIIIKCLGLSNLTFLMSCLPVPDNFTNEVNSIIFSFLWNKKPEKIKRKTLIRNYNMGGIKMCDFKSQCIALKCIWLKRYMYDDDGKWKCLFKRYLNAHGPNFLILNMNFVEAKNAPSLIGLPRFYSDLIKAWHNLDNDYTNLPIKDSIRVKSHIIWGNDLIMHNGKTLYFKHWIDSDIIYINDLINNDGIFSTAYILDKLKNKHNWIAELFIIFKSIPKKCFALLKANNMPIEISTRLRTSCIYVNKKRVNIMYWQSKYIYVHVVKKFTVVPIIQNRWAQELTTSPKWDDTWTMKTIFEKERKLAEFNYKLLYRIIATKSNLYKWNKTNSPICFECSTSDDYLHAFIACPLSNRFWDRFERFIISNDIPCPKISLKIIVLGYKPDNQNVLNVMLNRMISLASFTLYRSRLIKITDNKNVDAFKFFLYELRWRIDILRHSENMWNKIVTY